LATAETIPSSNDHKKAVMTPTHPSRRAAASAGPFHTIITGGMPGGQITVIAARGRDHHHYHRGDAPRPGPHARSGCDAGMAAPKTGRAGGMRR
jgi:hypothetical protein